MKLELYGQILEKYSNIKFCKNPSSKSRVVPCGRTDVTNLMVVSHNVASAPKTSSAAPCIYRLTCPVGCNYYKEFPPIDL